MFEMINVPLIQEGLFYLFFLRHYKHDFVLVSFMQTRLLGTSFVLVLECSFCQMLFGDLLWIAVREP